MNSLDLVMQNIVVSYADQALEFQNSSVQISNLDIFESINGLMAYNGSVLRLYDAYLHDIYRYALYLFNDTEADLQNIQIKNADADAITIFNQSHADATNVSIENVWDGVTP